MGSRRNAARLRLLGLALIAVLTTGFDRAEADTSSSHPCHRRLNGCTVCAANGGSCSVEFCADGGVEHNCF